MQHDFDCLLTSGIIPCRAAKENSAVRRAGAKRLRAAGGGLLPRPGTARQICRDVARGCAIKIPGVVLFYEKQRLSASDIRKQQFCKKTAKRRKGKTENLRLPKSGGQKIRNRTTAPHAGETGGPDGIRSPCATGRAGCSKRRPQQPSHRRPEQNLPPGSRRDAASGR